MAAVVLTFVAIPSFVAPEIAAAHDRNGSPARSRDRNGDRGDHHGKATPSPRAFSIGFDGDRRFPVKQGDVVAVGQLNPDTGTCVFDRPVGVLAVDSGGGRSTVRLRLSDGCRLMVASISHGGSSSESPPDPGSEVSPTAASEIPPDQSICFYIPFDRRHAGDPGDGDNYEQAGLIPGYPVGVNDEFRRPARPPCPGSREEHDEGR